MQQFIALITILLLSLNMVLQPITVQGQRLSTPQKADSLKAVTVNGLPVHHVYHSGYLRFEVSVPPKESADVHIVYSGGQNLSSAKDGVKYRAKALHQMSRRLRLRSKNS